jgi:hypothetical protein
VQPGDGSSIITGYKIEIQSNEPSVYYEDLTDCDGSQQTVVDGLQCIVPITTLLAEPFNLPWGSLIYAKVTAINVVGLSDVSDPGSGVQILTRPDPPINLENVPGITQKDQIGISWEKAVLEGGTPVIDYQVSQAEDGGAYSIIQSGLVDTTFTSTGLTAGVTYKFKVQARNAFDLSYSSQEISILAAQIPDKPDPPTSTVNGDFVDFTWTAPNSNGYEIFSYIIMIRTSDETVFATDSTDCDGNL